MKRKIKEGEERMKGRWGRVRDKGEGRRRGRKKVAGRKRREERGKERGRRRRE